MGLFQVLSTGPGTYFLDLPPSMAAIHPWFHTTYFKPAVLQSSGPLALEDNSYEIEAFLQFNKRGTQAKVMLMG